MDLGRPVARHLVRRPHEEGDADPGPADAVGHRLDDVAPHVGVEPARHPSEQPRAPARG